MVSTSFLCWLFLLGVRHSTCPSKSLKFRAIFCPPLAILLLQDSRFAFSSSPWARAQLTIVTEEEESLITFFGDEYVQYCRRVKTRIPFIP